MEDLAKLIVTEVFDGYMPSIRAVAGLLQVSASTVVRTRQRNPGYLPDEDGTIRVGKCKGLDGKIRPNRRFDTTDRDARIVQLRSAGKAVRAIAREVGCSVGTVHRVISSGL
jgi:DNA-binding NarL/FixJ family response regulator